MFASANINNFFYRSDKLTTCSYIGVYGFLVWVYFEDFDEWSLFCILAAFKIQIINMLLIYPRDAIKVGLDWFVLALVGVIGLAYLWPGPGVVEGSLSLQRLSGYGVSLIFFFYGLKLSPEQLRTGLANWRLHFVVQSVTFIVFPLLILLVKLIAGGSWDSLLWTGTFFLATLPSTVSSSVVMVSIARGNIPSAIFNASISSLLGVFLTPLWMGLVLGGGGAGSGDIGFDFADSVVKLAFQVLLPVALGILLHSRFGALANRNREKLKFFDQFVILLIVYVSFCESFANDMFAGIPVFTFLFLSLAMVVLFFIVFGITAGIGKLLKFSREDNITALFCGSKKSLVHGTVMAKVLFPGFAGAGVILLPLMIFHTLQLVAASIIAQRSSSLG